MASAAGLNPFDFRMKHFKEKKLVEVLKTAGDKFGWEGSPKSPSGRGFGIACASDAGTLVAMIVEIDVDVKSGEVEVKRVVCVQNMGLAIIPEGAAIQMEGCIMMGLGYSLKEIK
jgi:nicotinate dehydrogenase subunit B